MTRTVRVEHCMGTVFTVDVRDAGDWQAAIYEVVALLHRVDAIFSTYRPDSEVSRLRRRELRLADAHPDVHTVLDLCAEAQLATHAAFTALHDGQLDPTGLVKGWAIDRASELLRDRGSANHAVNGGGDVLVAGLAAPGRPWGVGIVDPFDRSRVIETITVTDVAVATSGSAERGAHIIDPFSGAPAAELVSATVVGPSMTWADAYATAAFVLGRQAVRWIAELPDYEALLVTTSGERISSTGWARRLAERLAVPTPD